MPALLVLGRPTGLAGDDISCFLALTLLFKTGQIGLLIPLGSLLIQPISEECVPSNRMLIRRAWYWLVGYWTLSAVLVLVTVVLNYTM
jgi:hypothetical protein